MSSEYNDERARPAAPAWATVPTTTWQRVEEPEFDDDGQPRPPRAGGTRGGSAAPQIPDRPGTGRATVPPQRSGQPAGAGPRPPQGPPYPPGQAPQGPYPPGQAPQGPYPPGGGPYPPGQAPPGPYPPGQAPQGPYPPGQAPRQQPPHQQGPYPPGHGPQQPGPYPPADPRQQPNGRNPGAPQMYAGPQQQQHPGRPGAPQDGRRPAAPAGAVPSWAGPTPIPGAVAPSVTAPPAIYGSPGVPASAPPATGSPAVAPTSGAPTSSAPTSSAPTSSAPGSSAPTSAVPASGIPASSIPASSAPASAPPAPSGPDPEQILGTFEWVFDPETLREVCEDPDGLSEIRDMLTAKVNLHTDNAARARLLSLRAVVSRILGDLHKALADAKLALAHAEATGELRRIAICQARLAHVLQWREEYAEADRLFAEANSSELPDRLRGTMHQHTGKSAYDQGRYIEACNHFEKALELRKEEDPDLMAATELALDAVFRRVAINGWGPYPRSREEILQIRKPPAPALDERSGLWGFAGAEGETRVPALYADVQPFRDGAAWVRRPEFETWELIDETGGGLISPTAGYLGVSSFSGGLAWVSRDGNGSWIAIDKSGQVTISTGFDDVRPFRRGIAAVRRGRLWGAVDGVGRVVVQFKFEQFATALSDGRYIDGFSDEGLAVVGANGRKGIVDRSGRMIVEPVFASLVIHPVAFLITDESGRWGALDRKGRILIDPTHPSRISVTLEIDRLLADARPVL